MELVTLSHHSKKVGRQRFSGSDDTEFFSGPLINVSLDLVVCVPLPQVTTVTTFVIIYVVIILATFVVINIVGVVI